METNKCNLCKTNPNVLTNLSCDHHICLYCFYKLCLFNLEKCKDLVGKEKEIEMECIICDSGTLCITKEEIMEKLNSTITDDGKPPNCTVHNKEINTYCVQCKTIMCESCFKNHKVISIFASHKQGENPNEILPLFQTLVHFMKIARL